MSWEDVARLIVACMCACLLGSNLAFVVHADRFFGTETKWVWRIFFLGKSLMTFFVSLVMWERIGEHLEPTWRLPVGFLAAGLSLAALVALYIRPRGTR